MNKIALVDVDSQIPNLALMKLSTVCKNNGDTVKLYTVNEPIVENVDAVYASKMFDWTPDYMFFPDNCPIHKGGPAYSLETRLPDWYDTVMPDYELYNWSEYAIGRFTRGCPNNCPWCVVPKMDGNNVHLVADLSDFWDERFDSVRLLDDNILADGDLFCNCCEQLVKNNVKPIWEALDIRLVNDQIAKALKSCPRHRKPLHFAWDNHSQDDYVGKGIECLHRNNIKSYRIMFYVLVGVYDDKEYDMHRIKTLWDVYGVQPYVCCLDLNDRYQRDLRRWCNNVRIFKSCTFDEYKRSYKNKN